MRYLVWNDEDTLQIDVWNEEQITHGRYADFHHINPSSISSGGRIYYNGEADEWILENPKSWKNIEEEPVTDKILVFEYIEKYLKTDEAIKKQLAQEWDNVQNENARIMKEHPDLASVLMRGKSSER